MTSKIKFERNSEGYYTENQEYVIAKVTGGWNVYHYSAAKGGRFEKISDFVYIAEAKIAVEKIAAIGYAAFKKQNADERKAFNKIITAEWHKGAMKVQAKKNTKRQSQIDSEE